jgi:VCBS repeat-containing protein
MYKPGTNREDTFRLISGVALYGGFAGTETSRGQRDWEANLTVLSGDIGAEGDSSDNSYHVVTGGGADLTLTTILDGFTVTGGNADGQSPNERGGGILIGGYCGPTLTNLIFSGNSAVTGGGMMNDACSPMLTNVTFSGNFASAEGGGMFNAFQSSPRLTNVTLSGNGADYGGGICNSNYSNPTFANTILWSNTAGTSGPQIYNDDTSAPSIQYSDVQDGCATIPGNDCSGGGNIDADPLFVRNPDPGVDDTWGTEDDDYGDLHLQIGSPAIDAGNNTAPELAGITTDLDGNPRFYDVPEIVDTGVGPAPVVDMGAYERQANNVPAAEDDSYSTDENAAIYVNAPGILANDSDPDGDSLSAMLESEPSSGSLDLNSDGSFDYLPETDYSGVVTFTYQATDGLLVSNTAIVTITVSSVNDAPIAVNDAYSTNENVTLTISAPGVLENDDDPDGDPLSAVLESGPSSGSLNLNPDGSFEYLPETDHSGVVTFTYQATDGLLVSNTATVTITVSSVNDAPIAVNDAYSTNENVTLTISAPGVLENDDDPDGDPLSAVLESEPSNGSLDLNPDGSFEYLPETDYSGVVTFTYQATDGLLVSNTAAVTITVSSVNDAPIAVNDAYSTNENMTLTINAPGVLENDSDPDDDPLSAVLVSGPSSGSLTLDPDGSFEYLPETDYSGVVTFTYQATDGLLDSNTATVTVTINGAPIAANDTYSTNENVTLTVNAPGVLENDSDPDGDPLNAVLESGPGSGSLDFNPDGSFSYVPEKDYAGTVTFTYHATDSLLDSDTATVTITVIEVWKEVYLPMIIR